MTVGVGRVQFDDGLNAGKIFLLETLIKAINAQQDKLIVLSPFFASVGPLTRTNSLL